MAVGVGVVLVKVLCSQQLSHWLGGQAREKKILPRHYYLWKVEGQTVCTLDNCINSNVGTWH